MAKASFIEKNQDGFFSILDLPGQSKKEVFKDVTTRQQLGRAKIQLIKEGR